MNIFIIHSGTDKNIQDKVKKITSINDPSSGYNKANVLFLNYRTAWKPEVKKLIRAAQIVLYILNEDGHKSKNIDWEIRQAIKQQKAIIVLNDGGYTLNQALYTNDPFSKKPVCIAETVESFDALFEIIEEYEQGKHIHLFSTEDVEPEMLFNQYKLFSDTSESLVSRRQTANSFYITANTALITIAATAFTLNNNLFSQLIITMILTLPGILLNRSWIKVMEAYSLINSSKMKILGLLEKKLAASLFDAEWEAMSSKYNKKPYVSFSDRERHLPLIFNWVYIMVDIFCVIILFVNYIL